MSTTGLTAVDSYGLSSALCDRNMLKRNHQFTKPEVLMFFHLQQHAIDVCSLMLLFSLLLHSCYFMIRVTQYMNKPLPLPLNIFLCQFLVLSHPDFRFKSFAKSSQLQADILQSVIFHIIDTHTTSVLFHLAESMQ